MLKQKALVIGMIVLFLGLTISPVTSVQLQKNEQLIEEFKSEILTVPSEKTVDIEYTVFDVNGLPSTETVTVTEQELEEIMTILSLLMEKIGACTDFNEVVAILEKFADECTNPVVSGIFGSFIGIFIPLLPIGRVFIMSHGWGYKIRPFRSSSIKIRRFFTPWHYGRHDLTLPAKTYMIKLFKPAINILRGPQIGWMTKFFGLYIYIARSFPHKSYTFFFGSAWNSRGIDLFL